VFPDFYRETEWEREFGGYVSNNQLPSLELVRFMHDHTGNFTTALNEVNTVELQQADNDYAVGALVEALAKSPYADDTLVFVLEDDAQDGADHVDAHRSIFFVAGPYVKHGAVVSTPYTTVNLLRTIEDILGLIT
jgi:Phosphoesterase family